MALTKDDLAQVLRINPESIREFQQSGKVVHVFLTDSQEILTVNLDKCKLADEKARKAKPLSQKQSLGVVLGVIGAIITLNGFSMDTTVSTEFRSVHNIGLIQEQNKQIQLGGILFIAGIVLYCLGGNNHNQPN